ncbi:hypothetical protein NCC49_005610 [Naganishia albida]|nr:hypothetical protein NCC49_005610 [Naganishia albida]
MSASHCSGAVCIRVAKDEEYPIIADMHYPATADDPLDKLLIGQVSPEDYKQWAWIDGAKAAVQRGSDTVLVAVDGTEAVVGIAWYKEFSRSNPHPTPGNFPKRFNVEENAKIAGARGTWFKEMFNCYGNVLPNPITTTMMTYYKATTSAIPRANPVAPQAAIGPRPTKASLLRASQIKEGKAVDKQGEVVIQQAPEVKKTGRPVGGEMKSKGKAGLVEKRGDGAAGKGKGEAANGVAAPAAVEIPKKVKFASDAKVRVYELSAGERVPSEGEKPELWEGEPEWKDLRELQWKNAEERASLSIKAKAWLRELEDENEVGETGYLRMMENRFKAIRLDEEIDNLKAKKTWEVVESGEFD